MLARFLYNSYAGLYTFSLWRKRHFTPVGSIMVTAFFLSGILGFNIYKTTLYQLLALVFSVMTVSMVLSLFPLRLKVRVNHILPEYASADETVTYQIEITNLSSKPQKGLILYEDINDPRPGFDTLLSKKEPYEQLRNAWDRKTMYYRWVWLIQKAQKARLTPIKLPDLPVGETVRVAAGFVPHHRGYIYFSGCTFARPDVLGLFMRLFSIKKAKKLLVLPRRYLLQSPDLMSSRQYHPGGVSLASSIGNSDEFMALRYYRPGDPMRNIHWRTFAKTNELVIKEFKDEYFVRHALILDTFFPSDKEVLFEEAVSIAASHIGSIQTHESIMDLMFAGNQIYSFSSGRGLACSEKMLEILACIEPCDNSLQVTGNLKVTRKTILDLVPTLEANIKKISGSLCIFAGWNTGHKKIYQMFNQLQVPVHVIVLAENKLEMEEKIFQDVDPTPHIKVVQSGQILRELGAA